MRARRDTVWPPSPERPGASRRRRDCAWPLRALDEARPPNSSVANVRISRIPRAMGGRSGGDGWLTGESAGRSRAAASTPLHGVRVRQSSKPESELRGDVVDVGADVAAGVWPRRARSRSQAVRDAPQVRAHPRSVSGFLSIPQDFADIVRVERRRAADAGHRRPIVGGPSVLLLDEPFQGRQAEASSSRSE